MSRSATLTTAPTNPSVYTLAGLDPSGSGRVLDSFAAAAAVAVPLPEAEPQRIALAGRVLEFETSILQSAPLIGGVGANHHPVSRPISIAPPREPMGTPWRRVTLTRASHSSAWVLGRVLRTARYKKGFSLYTSTGVSFFVIHPLPPPLLARVRGRLNNLLNCYGSQLDHLTAPRSPSVSWELFHEFTFLPTILCELRTLLYNTICFPTKFRTHQGRR